MASDKWLKYAQWPACDQCNKLGVYTDPKTGWPTECTKCKAGRENAVRLAQKEQRYSARGD